MAVEFSTFNSASAQMTHMLRGNGDLMQQRFSGHSNIMPIFFGEVCNQNGVEDFHSKIQPVLVKLLHDMLYSELGDGGHRCPYFPCPQCHRTRGMILLIDDTEFNHKPDTLIRCEEYYLQEYARRTNVQVDLFNRNDQSDVQQVIRSDGDGEHRCPYFPCPQCHRTRGIYICILESNNVKYCESDTLSRCTEERISSEYSVRPNGHVHLLSRNDQLACYGDGGHRCPYFPCPQCHRTRSIIISGTESSYHNVCKPDSLNCVVNGFARDTSLPSTRENTHPNIFSRPAVDKSVPTLICEGDGTGHRCPYFPCPQCHRTRGIIGTDSVHGDHILRCTENSYVFLHM